MVRKYLPLIALVPALVLLAGVAGATTAQTAPVATSAPTIQGTPTVGAVLSGNAGTWSGNGIKYAVSWVRCDSSGAACAAIPAANGTSYTVALADAGSTIRLSVAASDHGGTTVAQSDPTAVVPSPVASPAPPDSTPPSAPPALAVKSATQSSVSLQWSASSDNVGVTGYTISVNGVSAGSTGSTAFTVGGLQCGRTYTFGVEAVDAAGNHSATTTLAAPTSPCPVDTQPPTVPAALTVASSTQTSLVLTWSASTDNVAIAGYEISLNGTVIGSSTTTSFTVTGLSCGASYTVAVNAVDTSGNRSAKASLTTPAAACASSSIYWGAYAEGRQTYSYLYGGTWSNAPWCDPGTQCPLPQFTHDSGKNPSIEHYGQPPPWEQPFDALPANLVENRGDIPAIDMSTKNVPLRDIANGLYDASITAWAKAAKSWGHPFFFLPDEEMNGTWEPYSAGVNGNTAADFVNAWRHMHDIFTTVGASNVTWVWDPNIDPYNLYPASSQFYPGDAYVDWTGLNGYNWGGPNWATFSQLFKSSYDQLLQLAPTKPIMIGEIASAEAGGSKSAWITDALTTQLPQFFPKIKAVLWFNWRLYEKSTWWPWEIESSSTAQQAFATAISSPYYAAGGQLGNLAPLTKIQPPN